MDKDNTLCGYILSYCDSCKSIPLYRITSKNIIRINSSLKPVSVTEALLLSDHQCKSSYPIQGISYFLPILYMMTDRCLTKTISFLPSIICIRNFPLLLTDMSFSMATFLKSRQRQDIQKPIK